MMNETPELPADINAVTRHVDDSSIREGATAKVRLLLKLVQDYEGAAKDVDGGPSAGARPRSIARILTVLEDIKSGLEETHASTRRREPELRRCNTDLRRGSVASFCVHHRPRENHHRRPLDAAGDENQFLRKQLSATLVAQKSLENMFTSLGKEKEFMATELQRKTNKLLDLEEHLSDLRAQNETLIRKVRLCAEQHRNWTADGGDAREEAATTVAASSVNALQDNNRVLSEQLLRALEGCRTLKRKLIEVQEEKVGLQARITEIAGQVSVGLDRFREFCRGVLENNREAEATGGKSGGVDEEISSMERMLRGLQATMTSAVAGMSKGKKVGC